MSTSHWICNEERETLRRMRREGMTIDEIVILTGRSNTSVHEAVQDIKTTIMLTCGWCSEKFTWHPTRGRPPGYCCGDHRYQAALKRKRDVRSSVST